uniref:TRF2/HOY1 PH-like domain-containing protein n=2 Tax=Davidia involucrata TaxID=16924 RepID=A0A5B7AW36_DAVIN
MVQLMNSGKAAPESQLRRGKMVPVKLEVEDSLEDEHGPLNKRSKQQRNLGTGAYPVPPSQYNPLDEPSPLGLRLKKSPSLLDLIQMKLSQGNASKVVLQAKKEHKGIAASATTDKLKASNFPASFLRIGTWEYKSRYEGDLVAKCYFAKHKLVWEVLDGGLKNKIEIQWSDIMGMKANYPDDGPGTLDVVLARQPLFFRETNPQPRKHTLWQATSDFTGGQASINRRHFLQCPPGLLGKHFEKLIQCDPRLNFLSQQAEIVLEGLESPYFEPKISVFDDPNETDDGEGHTYFDLRDAASPSGAQSSSSKNEQDPVGRPPEHFSRETPSPSSVMDTHAIEEIRSSRAEELKRLSNQDQIKVPGFHPSMSMSDLVSQIEHRISEQRTSNNFILSSEEQQSLEILEDINRCLFSDSQYASTSDEQSIMSRVNSLCCLLQKDPVTVQNLQVKSDNGPDVIDDKRICELYSMSASAGESKTAEDFPKPEGEPSDVSGRKQAPAMSRKDSVGELLLNLPRIASLPQFLFNILEDFDNQAR